MSFKTRKRLGDLLVDHHMLARDVVESAMEHASNQSVKLGKYLIRQGLVSESDIANLLSQQLQVERYVPLKFPTSTDLKDYLPLELALKNQAVPLAKSEKLLIFGMTDPSDIDALDHLEQVTRCEVDAVICTERELNHLMTSVYGVGMGIGGILDNIDTANDALEDAELVQEENLEVSSLMNMAEGAPVVRMVNMIIAQAVKEGASDIHISPEEREVQLRYRVDGKLRIVPAPPKSMLLPIVSRVKVLAQMDIAVSRVPQDGRFTMKVENREINIRASAIPTINGENIVLRLLDMSAFRYTLETLGMSTQDQQRIENLIYRPYGMILSTGPTGSGKSTSLYAILQRLNTPDLNIITVEDPVEYRVPRIRQLQLNTRAGMTFASGLRSILRQDPDVIMVGEIRDAETANIAVQASLTGHRVLSTVHTNDSVGAITRLIDMGIEPFLVSSVLMTSFAQRLMRRTCPFCKERYQPSPDALRYLNLEDHTDTEYYTGAGCDNCSGTGFAGRVGIFEVLIVDEEIHGMISRNVPAQDIVSHARQNMGMQTLKEDAAKKVLEGITTVEEALATVFV